MKVNRPLLCQTQEQAGMRPLSDLGDVFESCPSLCVNSWSPDGLPERHPELRRA